MAPGSARGAGRRGCEGPLSGRSPPPANPRPLPGDIEAIGFLVQRRDGLRCGQRIRNRLEQRLDAEIDGCPENLGRPNFAIGQVTVGRCARSADSPTRACAIMLDAPRNIARRRAASSRSDARIEGLPSCPQDVARGAKVSRARRARATEFKRLFEASGFTGHGLQKFAQACRDNCWLETICPATSRRRPPPEHSTLSCDMPSASAAGPGSSAVNSVCAGIEKSVREAGLTEGRAAALRRYADKLISVTGVSHFHGE
jgi:hypothetical protein